MSCGAAVPNVSSESLGLEQIADLVLRVRVWQRGPALEFVAAVVKVGEGIFVAIEFEERDGPDVLELGVLG